MKMLLLTSNSEFKDTVIYLSLLNFSVYVDKTFSMGFFMELKIEGDLNDHLGDHLHHPEDFNSMKNSIESVLPV